MATISLFFLMCITLFCIIFRRYKASLISCVLTIMCFFSIGCGLIPAILLTRLQASFENTPIISNWAATNAIVLLGAGTTKLSTAQNIKPSMMAYSRINETARLYFDCIKYNRVCKIIISGGDPLNNGVSEANVYQKALLQLAINKNDIIFEPNSLNTFQNAEFTSDILTNHHFDAVYLVTSAIHLKRSLLYFSYFSIFPVPIAADYSSAHPAFYLQGYYFALTDFALHEYLGIARFYIYNFLGWNKKLPKTDAFKTLKF